MFLIGGGDFTKPDSESLKDCIEIFDKDGETKLNAISRDKLKYPRHGHSLTVLKDKFIIVTGSRIEKDGATKSVECYNVDVDIWFDYPSLNHGRYYHASCSF